MYSAVALVAFSFAGMANTGGEEKLEMKSNLELKTDPSIEDCMDAANKVVKAVKAILPFDMSFETELNLHLDALADCEANRGN